MTLVKKQQFYHNNFQRGNSVRLIMPDNASDGTTNMTA